MLHLFAELLFRRIVVLFIGAVAVFEGYLLLRSNGDEVGFLRRTLADEACVEIAEDLPRQDSVRSLAVLPLAGDPDEFLTAKLRSSIRASGKYELVDDSFFRKILQEGGARSAPVASFDAAVAAARRAGVDFALFGEVVRFETTEGGGALKVNLRLADRAARQAVFSRTFERTTGGGVMSSNYWRAHIADSSKWRRVLIWVLLVLLLPIVTAPLIRRITEQESNAWNLVVLIVYTAVDEGVAFALTGLWVPGALTTVVLLAALFSSAYYNYLAASLIEDLRK